MYADEPSGIRKDRSVPGSVQTSRCGETPDTKRIREDTNNPGRIQGKTETPQTSEETKTQGEEIKRIANG